MSTYSDIRSRTWLYKSIPSSLASDNGLTASRSISSADSERGHGTDGTPTAAASALSFQCCRASIPSGESFFWYRVHRVSKNATHGCRLHASQLKRTAHEKLQWGFLVLRSQSMIIPLIHEYLQLLVKTWEKDKMQSPYVDIILHVK